MGNSAIPQGRGEDFDLYATQLIQGRRETQSCGTTLIMPFLFVSQLQYIHPLALEPTGCKGSLYIGREFYQLLTYYATAAGVMPSHDPCIPGLGGHSTHDAYATCVRYG